MQRLVGNKAVSQAILATPQVVGHGTCSAGPPLSCSAAASRSFTKNLAFAAPVQKKKAGSIFYEGQGTITASFTTSVTISLAKVPPGLSDCATAKLDELIKTKLEPHEKDHKKRFNTTDAKHSYNGSFSKTLKETGADAAALQASLETNLESALADEATKRQDRNNAYAIDAIDPFNVTADISDCPECKGP